MTNDYADLLKQMEAELEPAELDDVKACLSGEKPARLGELLDQEPVKVEKQTETVQVEEVESGDVESVSGDIRTHLGKLKMAERLKAAMFGNSIVRRLLIVNPSRMVQDAVLSNPRLTVPEIEDFAKNSNMDSQVLRAIAQNSSWTRTYKVKLNLVTNPKTPQDISLKWLKFLNKQDIKNIGRSKNVPQVLQVAAKKLSELGE